MQRLKRLAQFSGIAAALLLLTGAATVYADTETRDDDTSEGLGPLQMNRWMEAQMDYAQALKKYGKGSPEATQSEVSMNTLARELGIKPTGEVPQIAPMEPPPPVDMTEVAFSSSPPLNTPAPMNVEPVLQESGTPSKN